MKKSYKIIILFIFVIILSITDRAYAVCYYSSSGNASGSATATSGGNSCNTGNCWAVSTLGVRFQLYKYTGGNSATLVGRAADVWSSNPSGTDISSKYTNDLNIRLSGSSACQNTQISMSDYNKQGDYFVDSDIYGRIIGGTVSSYILDSDYDKDLSDDTGFLKDWFLQKIVDGKDKEAKEFFGLNEDQYQDMKSKGGDYYITAEILYIHWTGNTYHFVTVSETAGCFGVSILYNALRVDSNGSNVGKLVTSSNSKIDKVSAIDGEYYYADGTPYISGKGYGMGIYWLKEICDECFGCESTCGKITDKGTPARMACAAAYCKTKEPDKTDCVSKCASLSSGTGCDNDQKCNTYINNYDKTKVKKNGTQYNGGSQPGTTCNNYTSNSSSATGLKTDDLSAKICYDSNDDFRSLGESTGQDVEYKVGGQKYSDIKYYRVTCDEDVKLKELPTKQKILLSTTSSSNITFSYLMTYTNSCKLEYKSADLSSWLSGNESDNYKNSLLKKHYDSIGTIKLNGKTVVSTKKPTLGRNEVYFDKTKMGDYECSSKKKAEYPICDSITRWKGYNGDSADKDRALQEEMVGYYLDMKYDFELTRTRAKSRVNSIIKNMSEGDVDLDKIVQKNDLAITVLDYNKNGCGDTEEKVELIPVICMPSEDTNYNTNAYVCFINGKNLPAGYKVRIEGQTNFKCENATTSSVDTAKGTGQYTYSVYYALPSSYISAQAASEDVIYRNSSRCQGDIRSANGFCKEIQYSYTLPRYIERLNKNCYPSIDRYKTAANAKTSKLKLDFVGGLCHELQTQYTCDYEVETEYCEVCKNKIGTSEYQSCFETNCKFDCNKYCGTNQICRAKYCPELCEGCNWIDVKTTYNGERCTPGQPGCCTSCDESKCDSLTGKGTLGDNNWTACIYDECCTKSCNGNESCTTQCCVDKCVAMYGSNPTKKTTCITECNNGSNNYIYRSISLSDPFPAREDNVGANWYNKIRYITNDFTNQGTGAEASKYADATNGVGDSYEYKIEITSDQLKQIKKDSERADTYYNTYYTQFKNKNKNTLEKKYESEFLRKTLSNDFGVDVSITP